MGQPEDRKSLSMTVLMTPDMANFAGKVHGGTLLKFLDQVAYSCASRYAGTYVVTLSVDRVLFRDAVYWDFNQELAPHHLIFQHRAGVTP
jgi:acyl-CoA hydrolase